MRLYIIYIYLFIKTENFNYKYYPDLNPHYTCHLNIISIYLFRFSRKLCQYNAQKVCAPQKETEYLKSLPAAESRDTHTRREPLFIYNMQ
jgi:hypothetical protein